jgi:hypothetical protein
LVGDRTRSLELDTAEVGVNGTTMSGELGRENFRAAREMYVLEHTRWNHHMILFLGVIASVLTGAWAVREAIPLEFSLYFAALVSLFWLFAIQANRATSYAWLQTLLLIEKDPTTNPFITYREKRGEFSLCEDFWANLGIVPEPGSIGRRFLAPTAITRIYAVLAFSLAIGLVALAIFVQLRFITTSSAVEQELGQRLIHRELASHYSDAQIAGAFGPIRRTDGVDVIQLHITLPNKEHVMTNWALSGDGAAIEDRPR